MEHEFQPATEPSLYHHQHQFEKHEPRLERLHFEDDEMELAHEQLSNFYNQQHYLTIEDIKSTRNSCWLCGCNWLEDHVSLDCPECGGYALSRPCPNCEGKCQQTWTRNITATHDRHRALWVGQCKLQAGKQAAILSEAERFKAAAQAAATIISSNRQMIFSPVASNSPYQTAKASVTTTSPIAINTTSSCCSSQPSSAATSDEEPDDLSTK